MYSCWQHAEWSQKPTMTPEVKLLRRNLPALEMSKNILFLNLMELWKVFFQKKSLSFKIRWCNLLKVAKLIITPSTQLISIPNSGWFTCVGFLCSYFVPTFYPKRSTYSVNLLINAPKISEDHHTYWQWHQALILILAIIAIFLSKVSRCYPDLFFTLIKKVLQGLFSKENSSI